MNRIKFFVGAAKAMGARTVRTSTGVLVVFPSGRRYKPRELSHEVLDREASLKWSGAISRDGHGPFYVLALKFFDPSERRWFDVTPLKGLGPRPARALIESLGLDLKLPELPPAVEPHRMKETPCPR